MIKHWLEYAMAYDSDHWPVMRNWENWAFCALFILVPVGLLAVFIILPMLRVLPSSEKEKP